MVFMLLSYMVLPAQKTRSHYLSVCLIISVMMIAISYTIPLAAQPDQCHDEITPNDMFSSTECAWSGAFVIAGGLCSVMWILIRAISMNLQICWDIVPGKKFFYFSQLFGWGIPAALFTTTITLTGVSFRFGSACSVNHRDSMGDFWGPLLAFAALAGIFQITTFGYCINVYLKNLWNEQDKSMSSNSGSALPSYSGSVRTTQTARARAVYTRLRKVIWLQWRGMCIVCIILVDVVFLSIVFVYLDSLQSSIGKDWSKLEPWLVCLAEHPTDKNACLHLVGDWFVHEAVIVAVLLLLSMTGLQVFLLLTRPSVFSGWWKFIKAKTVLRSEFVSLDARPEVMKRNSQMQLMDIHRGHQSTTFEIQQSKAHDLGINVETKRLSPTLSTPSEIYRSPLKDTRGSPSIDTNFESVRSMSPPQPFRGRVPSEYVGRITPSPNTPIGASFNIGYAPPPTSEYFHPARTNSLQNSSIGTSSIHSERRYQNHALSFSAPRPPSRHSSSIKSVSFDPRDTYSRSGAGGDLALNPPSEAAESERDTDDDAPSHTDWYRH